MGKPIFGQYYGKCFKGASGAWYIYVYMALSRLRTTKKCRGSQDTCCSLSDVTLRFSPSQITLKCRTPLQQISGKQTVAKAHLFESVQRFATRHPLTPIRYIRQHSGRGWHGLGPSSTALRLFSRAGARRRMGVSRHPVPTPNANRYRWGW